MYCGCTTWRRQWATTLRTHSSSTHEPWMRCAFELDADEQQHVAVADQLLGAGLVEDDAGVGERAHREREPARDVGLDDTGDDVDRRALRRDHEVDADGAGHLRDAADALLDVARRHHHEVVELVDDDDDVREPLVALVAVRVGVLGGRQVAAVEHRVVTR